MNWHRVAKVSDLKLGEAQLAVIEGRSVALFRTASGFHAIDGVCPHRGGPLVEGAVEDDNVVCPWHAWTFDLVTGACESTPSFRQTVYPVKVENGEIFVEV